MDEPLPSRRIPGPARRSMRFGAALAVGAATIVAAGCGSDTSREAIDVGDTLVGVGEVPPVGDSLTLPPSGTLASGADVPAPDGTVGERAEGNRLVLIGDSILAGTSRRYGDEACATLVPLGWQVAVEAEVGRAVDFGNRVLDRRPPEDWDAAVVFLGTNYGGDPVRYATELDRILDRLAPRPVVLVTVSNHSPEQVEVNEVIEREVLTRDDVDVFDWTTVSEAPGVLTGDGVHPTDAGRRLLVDGLARLLGRAPRTAGVAGQCLASENVDDSAGATGSRPWTSTPRTSTPRPTPRPTVPAVTSAPPTDSAPTSPSTGSVPAVPSTTVVPSVPPTPSVTPTVAPPVTTAAPPTASTTPSVP